MTNPRRSILVFTFALGLICAIGCTKRTPVEEISVAESNVVVAESRASELELAWPEWRGGTQGIATAEVPTNWGGSENIRWEASVPGRGHSSPIVVGNSVILGSAIESKEEQLVLAYDRETGDEQWRCVVHSGGFPAKKEVHQKATNANVTVASDGNALVTANFNDGRIWVSGLDLQGNILWQRDVGAFNSKFGYAPSPIIYKSLAIVAADNRGGGYLAGIDIQTGEIAWRRARGDASSYSSPTIVTSDGQAQVVITGGDRMASYSPENGELLWETECISEATCGTVVAAGDRIYASGGYPDRETICLSSTGEKIWSSRTKIYEPSLITDGGNVFAVSDDGIAYCWSGDDGSVLWNKRLGGNFSSSPVISNGNLIVADLSGNQYVLKATGDGFEQVARNRYGDDCYASPAIAGDAIFFRLGFGSGKDRKEKLVCVGS
ncbi:MAG: PQQ-binding-like beta-propeller repeat protein [Planctomycetota bacterium]